MDNKLVYHTIKNLVLNSTAYSCIIKWEKAFNDRAAYKALERIYLGPHVTQLIQRTAEKIVNTSVFTGVSRNMTLDMYNDRIKKAWHDIDICGLDTKGPRLRNILVDFKSLDWNMPGPLSIRTRNFVRTLRK